MCIIIDNDDDDCSTYSNGAWYASAYVLLSFLLKAYLASQRLLSSVLA